MAPSRKLHAWLHALTGGGCILGALAIHLAQAPATHWQLLQEPLLATGIILGLLAGLRRHQAVARLSTDLCLSLLAIAATITVLELGFRLAGFDFRRLELAHRRLPPFYRKPTVPTGGAFFRRSGPERWKGQVIRTCLRVLRLPDAAYVDEPTVEVRYDVLGFRNEPAATDWEVAIAGDSFTELGFLPYEELFTTVLARRTGWRVRNLGVSHTGPLSQLSYLEDYGRSTSTRRVVIVFYEGNDLADLDREQLALDEFERTGRYDPEEYRRQTSLLRALADWVAKPASRPAPERVAVDAYWSGPTGEVALTLEDAPAASGDVTPETREAFDRFLARYAAFAREHRLVAWLAYMPSKLRVLYGRVRLTETGVATVGDWVPTDLPSWVSDRCARAGIEFLDLTSPLVEGLEADGALPFNALYDTHVNAVGADVVGQALARALWEAPREPR